MLQNYDIDHNGVIYQINKTPISYDSNYMEKYNNLGEIKNYMANLRFGYLVGSLGFIPESILDVGYGNGDFLKSCSIIKNRFGYDVSNYPLPDGCKLASSFSDVVVDVTTFFDSLEHFDNPYIIKELKSEYVVVSVPECHYFSDDWFLNWRHLRPNEHLWHFNKKSLINFMNEIGYSCVNTTNIEDSIRVNKDNLGSPNILTGTFKKNDNIR